MAVSATRGKGRTRREGSREWRARVWRSPAVRDVNGTRISYTDEFKVHLLSRLLEGKGPSEVFREVGLPSELVGQKRIERTAARVRQDETIAGYLNEYGDPWPSDGWGPTIPDDPWAAIMSMSYRINYLDKRVRELERLVDGTVPPVAVGAAHGGGGE